MSENIKEKIIDFLNIDQFLSFSSLLLKLESNEEELEIALNELENDNIIHQGKKGKYGLLSSYHWYIGEIRLKKQGYGFFKCDELEEDVYISIYNLEYASKAILATSISFFSCQIKSPILAFTHNGTSCFIIPFSNSYC